MTHADTALTARQRLDVDQLVVDAGGSGVAGGRSGSVAVGSDAARGMSWAMCRGRGGGRARRCRRARGPVA